MDGSWQKTAGEWKNKAGRRILMSGILIAAGIGLFVVIMCFFGEGGPLCISVNGDSEVRIECGQPYADAGARACFHDQDVSGRIRILGEVDAGHVGEYRLTYAVRCGIWRRTAGRTVYVVDTTGPVITLNGDPAVSVARIEDYVESGATAVDQGDEGSAEVTVSALREIDDHTYEVCYEAQDSAGNRSVIRRQIVVEDTQPPEISLNGEAAVTILEREKYRDPGATAVDDRDGDVSERIQAKGYVDIYRPGQYTITYTVEDNAGNQSQAVREVTVERVHQNPQNAIYLTFDDGPNIEVTGSILDTLKKNNIKATFFICAYGEAEKPLVQRMVAEGHTVGIHGYSHVYADIYQSVSVFMDNIYTLKNKLKEDTGYDAFVVRFPGGSANLVSKEYAPGIMTEIVKRVTEEDLMYLDWNVSGEDALGQKLSKNQVAANVIDNLKTGRTNVVLLHDTGAQATSAQALQDIIDYGLKNGYSFYAVSEDTVPIHQGVKN